MNRDGDCFVCKKIGEYTDVLADRLEPYQGKYGIGVANKEGTHLVLSRWNEEFGDPITIAEVPFPEGFTEWLKVSHHDIRCLWTIEAIRSSLYWGYCRFHDHDNLLPRGKMPNMGKT